VQTSDYQQRVALLQAEADRFTQYLDALPAAAWNQPSACGQWQVQDVVAHLVGVAEFYADNITRGQQGDTAPPPGRPPAGSITAAMAAAGVASRAINTRQQLGSQLLATFQTTQAHLSQVLTELPAEARVIPCYHPGGIVEAQQFIDLRLKELAVHEWDIRSRLHPPAHLALPGLQAIIRLIDQAVASGSLRWGFSASDHLAAPIRYRFEVTGAVPYHTDIVITGDTSRQETGATTPADVTFRCDTETFVLLVYGRLTLDAARHHGDLIVQGKEDLMAPFSQWFKGI
jgi:uncharacterized protein (TIGR03083 family)